MTTLLKQWRLKGIRANGEPYVLLQGANATGMTLELNGIYSLTINISGGLTQSVSLESIGGNHIRPSRARDAADRQFTTLKKRASALEQTNCYPTVEWLRENFPDGIGHLVDGRADKAETSE